MGSCCWALQPCAVGRGGAPVAVAAHLRPAARPPRRRHLRAAAAQASYDAGDQQSAVSAAAAAAATAATASLQAELRELRTALARQQEAQAAALQLIQEQQTTISALEQRVLSGSSGSGGGGSSGGGSQAAAVAAVEAPGGELPGQPLDGPEAVLEPTALERPVQASYSGEYKATVASGGGAKRDLSLLPERIVLVRHAQSKGNVDPFQYTFVPDPSVPLTSKGWEQAIEAGERLRALLESGGGGGAPRVFCYTSPYLRCKQTTEGLVQAFSPEQLLGVQEEVMLREQDFGNFQDADGKKREKLERLRYGRFFYRFPHGESGADVYNRMTIFQSHLIRDMEAGRFGGGASLVLVTHGLAARIWLMRWFHWTVEQFLAVWNPPNAEPIVMERIPEAELAAGGAIDRLHTKALYRLSAESRAVLTGCTDDMCITGWSPRGIHWGHEAEAAPEEGPTLRQSSVAYQ